MIGNKKYTKEALLEILKNEYLVHGFVRYSYFMNKNGLPSRSTYDKIFGNWKNALILAKIPIEIKKIKVKREKQIKWNKNMLRDGFLKLYIKLGYIPSLEEINECECLPSSVTIYKYYKSIYDICIECDIDIKIKPRKSHKEKKIKKDVYIEKRIILPPDREIWKDLILINIKNYYEVSNLGNVRNKNTNRILKSFDDKGYRTIGLRNNKKTQKNYFVHRLVAIVFLGLDENNKETVVHHINSNTICNHINNLELCTSSQNAIYAQNNKKRRTFGGYACDLNNEEWKYIIGYEDLYMISNYGRVKNNKNYLLIPSIKEYKAVGLSKNSKQKSYRIHRLVAMAFIENPNNYPVVNHKDGNKLNNHVDNLEWCTKSQNSIHAHLNGLVNTVNNFKDIDIINIINLYYHNNIRIIKISQVYKTNTTTIANIVKFKCNKYEQFKYLLNN